MAVRIQINAYYGVGKKMQTLSINKNKTDKEKKLGTDTVCRNTSREKRSKINMSTLGNLKDFIYGTAITDW